MAERSGFFNSSNGDRKYKADFFAEYFSTFIGNGVFPNPSTGLQTISNGDMTVTIKAGKGWINGYVYINDSDLILPIEVADGVLNRIDRVVLQFSTVDRIISAKVRKGTFASTPSSPTLQRDADIYELALADIAINKGTTSISQSNIVDLRMNSDLCGVVQGTINQVDLTTIFNQFEAWFQETKTNYQSDFEGWSNIKRTEFEEWFLTIQGLLNQDVAGILTQDVLDIKEVLKRIAYYNDYGITLDVETGIWTERQWKREDGTIYMKSILSNKDIEYRYTKDTWEIYKEDGVTLSARVIWTLTYNKDSSAPKDKTYLLEVL